MCFWSYCYHAASNRMETCDSINLQPRGFSLWARRLCQRRLADTIGFRLSDGYLLFLASLDFFTMNRSVFGLPSELRGQQGGRSDPSQSSRGVPDISQLGKRRSSMLHGIMHTEWDKLVQCLDHTNSYEYIKLIQIALVASKDIDPRVVMRVPLAPHVWPVPNGGVVAGVQVGGSLRICKSDVLSFVKPESILAISHDQTQTCSHDPPCINQRFDWVWRCRSYSFWMARQAS